MAFDGFWTENRSENVSETPNVIRNAPERLYLVSETLRSDVRAATRRNTSPKPEIQHFPRAGSRKILINSGTYCSAVKGNLIFSSEACVFR